MGGGRKMSRIIARVMRRRLGGLGITRTYIPLFIWVTSLKLCKHKHIPHCWIKMWQSNPEIGWADPPFFSPTFRNNPPYRIHFGLVNTFRIPKSSVRIKSSLNLSGKYFWKQNSLPLHVNPQKSIQMGEGKAGFLVCHMPSLCSKILLVQLFICVILHSDVHCMQSCRDILLGG